MRNSAIYLFFFALVYINSFADTYMPVNIELPEKNQKISSIKVDLAFDFAFKLIDKAEYISVRKRDSIAHILYESGRSIQAINVAQELEAQKLIFARINILENIIRTDISIVDIRDTSAITNGFGYGLVSHFDPITGEKIYDPALLTSIKRALAVAMSDSLLFVDSTKGFEVYPAPTLVIGGIFYVQDGSQLDWDLFKNHVITSYTAVESIFESIYKHNKYVVYDMASRDSLYAIFRLYGVENYTAPSQYELSILEQAGVDYFITGSIERTASGAKVRLALYAVRRGSLTFIKEREGILEADDLEKYQILMRKLAGELLD